MHRRDDLGLLWLGKAILEAEQETPAYISAKGVLERQELAAQEEKSFLDAMAASRSSAGAEEQARRDAFRRKVPTEPDGRSGASMLRIQMGNDSAGVKRRFASDDTLRDVVHFIGSLNSAAPAEFGRGEWDLWDFSCHPPRRLACMADDAPKTLYTLELWPAATLMVAPKGFDVSTYYRKLGWGHSQEGRAF
eukprot:SAG11_NODE_9820_length_878_cov_1.563543_2_plen_192_part_00